MSVSSSWIHGNALTIESPISFGPDGQERGRLVLTPSGPGAWVSAERGGEASWMHLPIPTINGDVSRFNAFELLRVFLLFECRSAQVRAVHVYDGYHKIQEFNVWLQGNYLVKSHQNTLHLKKPHEVRHGIGLSFLFTADILIGGPGGAPSGSLFVAAAGADFMTRNRLFSRLFPF